MTNKLITGIWPALVTPFSDDSKKCEINRLNPLVDHLINSNVNGFFVTGSTGEGLSMSFDERKIMVEATIATVNKQVPLVIQVGGCPTAMAVELAQHAIKTGADAIATVAPIDRPNDLEAAVKHYTTVGKATDAPFYVYWIAQTADRNVSAEQYLEAMREVPNFCGLKFTDSNFYLFQRLVALAGKELNFISGPDEICLGGMVAGADAAIGSTYNIMPKIFLQMRSFFEAGKIQQAMELQSKANHVISIMMDFNIIGAIKQILKSREIPVGIPRPPHTRLTQQETESLLTRLDQLDFVVE